MSAESTPHVRPERPRVLPGLPVLSRSPRQVQFGYRWSTRGTDAVYKQVRALDGSATFAELLAASDQPDELTELVDTLAEAGLVEDLATVRHARPARLAADTALRAIAGQSPQQVATDRADAAVVVHGDGRIAIGVAAGLAAAGIGQVSLVVRGRVGAEDCGTGYRDQDIGRLRSDVATEVVKAASSSVKVRRLTSGRVPELAILADSLTPAPGVAAALHGARVPHLLTYARDEVAVVGPLVVPGETTCVRCVDLWRSEHDECWPRVATQIAGRAQPTSVALAATASAFATAQALLFIDGLPTPKVRGAAVDIHPDAAEISPRSWEAHPSCGCLPRAAPDEHPP